MALRLSSGCRTELAGTSGLKSLFDAGFISIFTGGQPANADTTETGVRLATITSSSGTAGIAFGTAGTGALPKAASVWSGTIGVTGVAGWFRLYGTAGTASGTNGTANVTIDGNVGVSGSDLVLSHSSLVAGATLTIDTFTLEVPAA
jgi:hypothetical protein